MKEKCYSYNRVCNKKLKTFKPVTFSIGNNEIDDYNGENNRDELKSIKDKTHGCRKKEADEHQNRSDDEGNLGS